MDYNALAQLLFPRQLEGVDAHMFWKAVNKASPSPRKSIFQDITQVIVIKQTIEHDF